MPDTESTAPKLPELAVRPASSARASSIARTLQRSTLIVLALFALAGAASWVAQRQASGHLARLVDVVDPVRIEALEMEINLREAGMAVLGHLRTGEPQYFEELDDALGDYNGHSEKFTALATAIDQQATAKLVAAAFERYRHTARRLIEGETDKRRQLQAWRARLERVEILLETAPREARASAATIGVLIDGMGHALEGHLHSNDPDALARLTKHRAELAGELAGHARGRWRSELMAQAEPLEAMSAQLVALRSKEQADSVALLAQQREFDRILDEDIQAPIERLVVQARRGVDEWTALATNTLIGALLAAALLGSLLMRRAVAEVRSGIRRLDGALAAVTRGDENYRVPPSADDEFGRLGSAFNHMAAQVQHARHGLERSNAELERSVAQRTQLLQQANEALVQANHELSAGHERLRVAATVFESAHEAIIVSDRDGRVIAANPASIAMTGYAANALEGRATDLLHGDEGAGGHESVFDAAARDALHEGSAWEGERLLRRADGRRLPVAVKLAAVRDEHDELLFTVSTFSDLGPLKAAEARLRHLADHDPLTGLPGRRLMVEFLAGELPRAERRQSKLALLVVEPDRLAGINEVHGHDTGDALLRMLAARTRACLERDDRLYQIGREALGIVVCDLERPADVIPRAARLLEALAQRRTIRDIPIAMSVSIGIGVACDDATEPSSLIAAARTALRRASELGGNNAQFFTLALGEQSRNYVNSEAALRHALAEQHFLLHFQPQFDCASGILTGFEALTRWRHPELGLVSLGPYVEVAEESGLIHLIGEWALGEACRQASDWPEANGRALRVAVNVSPRQVLRGGLVEQAKAALRASGLVPERLELEITESSLQGGAGVVATLHELKSLGLELALDDFGVGYSSLASLRHLPVDRLKIDRSFIADVLTDEDNASIVQTILAIGRGLGRRVTAEGVEDRRQLDWLRRGGCNEYQGFLASAPMSGASVAAFIGACAAKGSAGNAPRVAKLGKTTAA